MANSYILFIMTKRNRGNRSSNNYSVNICFLAAFKALNVPSTAGLIKSCSFLGCLNGNGEAVCIRKSQPIIDSSHPSSFNKSRKQNSKSSGFLNIF